MLAFGGYILSNADIQMELQKIINNRIVMSRKLFICLKNNRLIISSESEIRKQIIPASNIE